MQNNFARHIIGRFGVASGALIVGIGMTLAIAAPAQASIAGSSLPAVHPSAVAPTVAGCPSGDLCFWVNANFTGGGPGEVAGNNNNWSVFPQPACKSGTWNDCASSLDNNDPTRSATVYKNSNLTNPRLCLNAGQSMSNLTLAIFSDGSVANDSITSNSFSRNPC
jgi:hypothetical protein